MILAIDTAFGPIGVALLSPDFEIVAHEVVPDALGAQAEKLPPLVAQILERAGIKPGELTRLAVTTGPGAFTGVRVGLAFAKGMAMALKVPLLGFTTLECLIAQARVPAGGSCAAVVDARRGEYYAQGAEDLATAMVMGIERRSFGPALMTGDEVRAHLNQLKRPLVLVGSGARLIEFGDAEVLDILTVDAGGLAQLAYLSDPAVRPPVPCYLRAPDAKLPS